MKKTLLMAGIATAFTTTSTLAHDGFNFNGKNQCNLEFNNTLRVDKSAVEITDSHDQTLRIDNNANVFIDGKEMDLTSKQRQAAQDYANGIRQQLPKVADIALEGVELAGVALEEVSEALGVSSFGALHELMDEVATELHASFYDGDTFVFDEKNFDNIDMAFGEEFEAKMEEAIEATMTESIGSILVAIGSEMMSSGGNMSAMEKRFERMGETLEAKMETEAAALEEKAEQLCDSFLVLAQQENELQSLVPGIKNYDLFVVKTKH